MLNINKNNRLITAPFQKQVINDPDKQIIEHLQTEDTEINYNNFQFQRLETIQNLKFDRYVGPTPESNWVIPGLLLVGAYPASDDDDETFELIISILKEGVKKFVCLQSEYQANVTKQLWKSGAALRPYFVDVQEIVSNIQKFPEYQNYDIVTAEKLSFEHCPIIDCGITDDDKIIALSSNLVKSLSTGEIIYLHCWGGHGRTGTVVCVMLHIMYGISAKEAFEYCQAVHDIRKCPVEVGSPQTQQQRNQVIRIIEFLMKKTKMNQKTASIAPNTDYDMDIAPPLKLIKISNQPSQLNNITHSAASEATLKLSIPDSNLEILKQSSLNIGINLPMLHVSSNVGRQSFGTSLFNNNLKASTINIASTSTGMSVGSTLMSTEQMLAIIENSPENNEIKELPQENTLTPRKHALTPPSSIKEISLGTISSRDSASVNENPKEAFIVLSQLNKETSTTGHSSSTERSFPDIEKLYCSNESSLNSNEKSFSLGKVNLKVDELLQPSVPVNNKSNTSLQGIANYPTITSSNNKNTTIIQQAMNVANKLFSNGTNNSSRSDTDMINNKSNQSLLTNQISSNTMMNIQDSSISSKVDSKIVSNLSPLSPAPPKQNHITSRPLSASRKITQQIKNKIIEK